GLTGPGPRPGRGRTVRLDGPEPGRAGNRRHVARGAQVRWARPPGLVGRARVGARLPGRAPLPHGPAAAGARALPVATPPPRGATGRARRRLDRGGPSLPAGAAPDPGRRRGSRAPEPDPG